MERVVLVYVVPFIALYALALEIKRRKWGRRQDRAADYRLLWVSMLVVVLCLVAWKVQVRFPIAAFALVGVAFIALAAQLPTVIRLIRSG